MGTQGWHCPIRDPEDHFCHPVPETKITPAAGASFPHRIEAQSPRSGPAGLM